MLIINDTHVKSQNTDYVYSIFCDFLRLAKSRGDKDVFHGGDVFTTRFGQSLESMLMMQKIFDLFAEAKIKMHVIPGNHDKTDQSKKESFLTIFKNHEAVVLHDEYDRVKINGKYIHFIPFFTNDVYLYNLKQNLKHIRTDAENILLTHIEIKGALNNDGDSDDSAIPTALFKKFDKVFIGHFHDRQKINKDIIYLGSAYQNNFGESEQYKGFHVYENGQLKYFQAASAVFYRKHEAASKDEVAKIVQNIQNQKDIYYHFIKNGNKLRIEYYCAEDENPFILNEQIKNLEIKPIYYKKEGLIEEENVVESLSALTSDKKSNFIKYCRMNKITGKRLVNGLKMLNSFK